MGIHENENIFEFLWTVQGKWRNVCVFIKTSSHLITDSFHCTSKLLWRFVKCVVSSLLGYFHSIKPLSVDHVYNWYTNFVSSTPADAPALNGAWPSTFTVLAIYLGMFLSSFSILFYDHNHILVPTWRQWNRPILFGVKCFDTCR